LIVNEARSICENFVEAGFNVPKILSNGLAVADKLINKESEDEVISLCQVDTQNN
ncbi:phage holin family protein, partial [[Clostridium] innocuum]|nr:phage holin family protein [[Clostridium] innocuum]